MKYKKIIVFVLVVIAASALFNIPAIAQTLTSETEGSTKNETVYGMLNNNGSVESIYVVNQLIGTYTDYGEYTDIINLSTSSEPAVDGDKITFEDEYVDGGLYYQGTMEGELPMVFNIAYYLDGKPATADMLAGQSGHVRIVIKGSVNENCDEDVRDGLMAQITMTLDQSIAENIEAEGATTVITGSTATISYTILPGESGTMIVEADVQEFEMDAITIMLLKGSVSGMDDTIDELNNGFDEMIDGADEMVDGTAELQDGIVSLVDGVDGLADGLSSLSSSGKTIHVGMEEYDAGLLAYTSGIEDLTSASVQIQDGLDTLAQSGTQAAGGVSDISTALTELSTSSAELETLAESMLTSSDPNVQALAQGIIETLSALGQISDGLAEASLGVDAYTAGVAQTASEYAAFHEGLAAASGNGAAIYTGYVDIESGFSSYLSGINSSASGARKIYDGIEDMPESIQEMIDGQTEFRDGIIEAKEKLTEETDSLNGDDTPAVSFASPDKNTPDSVQYILMTPGIAIEKDGESTLEEESQENFFTRLFDLFE